MKDNRRHRLLRRVLSRGLVFDGTSEAPRTTDIAIEGDRIVDVGSGLDGDERIDIGGYGVVPGLIDCHVHVWFSGVDIYRDLQTPFSYRFFEAARNLGLTLDAGVTTVRDAAGADLGIKNAVADGLIRGPRMQISIAMIGQTGGHSDEWLVSGNYVNALFPNHPGAPSGVADGNDEVRRKVRELIRAGADVIKVAASGGVVSPRSDPRRPHLSLPELETLVEEAGAAQKFVMAHALATDGIKNALRAGVRSIEHGICLDEQAIEEMVAGGTFLVPTLTAVNAVIDAAASGVALNPDTAAKARDLVEMHRRSIRAAISAGVKIAMGSDAGVAPHGRNPDELEHMVKLGMMPLDAVRAATSVAAELLGLSDELGTIEPGKRADVVIVEGSPIDVRHFRERIVTVYKDGVVASSRLQEEPTHEESTKPALQAT